MMKRISSLILGFALVFPAFSAFAGENCTCRYKGKDIAEGLSVCMNLPNGSSMARCERVLNNTSWKILKSPCPLADNSSNERGHRENMTRIEIPTTG